MFNRSRKKIILSIMGSLILLFSVTLSVILAASFREVRHRNSKMLEHYVQTYSLEDERSGGADRDGCFGSADCRTEYTCAQTCS